MRRDRFSSVPVNESAVAEIVPRDEARAVFGSEDCAKVEPLRPRPLGATVGVWRVNVSGKSAVLKLLRLGAGSNVNWAASPEPDHPRWWRRELFALEDGLLDVLRPELRPPTLLHAADRPDGSLALWLEDLGAPAKWTIEALARVAGLLGVAQRRAVNQQPGALPRGFLRAYLEPRIPHLAEPFASQRERILSRLDALPQTLSHFDFHPANIFRADRTTAVIDWAYCGCGPVGADAGVLAADALADEVVPHHQAPLLVNAIWEAYRDGLADEALAHAAAEAYGLGTALRYAWFPAWVAGEYGPQPDERRSRGVVAANATFVELATDYL
jgi:Phosphotransferase enzyme family